MYCTLLCEGSVLFSLQTPLKNSMGGKELQMISVRIGFNTVQPRAICCVTSNSDRRANFGEQHSGKQNPGPTRLVVNVSIHLQENALSVLHLYSMGGATLSPLRPGLHQILKKFQITSFTNLIPRLVISFCVVVYYITDYSPPLIGIVERLKAT